MSHPGSGTSATGGVYPTSADRGYASSRGYPEDQMRGHHMTQQAQHPQYAQQHHHHSQSDPNAYRHRSEFLSPPSSSVGTYDRGRVRERRSQVMDHTSVRSRELRRPMDREQVEAILGRSRSVETSSSVSTYYVLSKAGQKVQVIVSLV